MEVKAAMNLKTLPRVFILPDGIRIAVTDPDSFVNCNRYEECLILEGAEIKRTDKIYYVKDPAITVSFRKATLKSVKDVEELLEEIQPFEKLDAEKLLVRYHYFGVKIYDKFKKGKTLEFPIIAEIDNIKVHKVPEPPGVYIYTSDMEKKLDPDQFHKTKYLRFTGHDIEFNKDVLEYLYLSAFNGYAELLYIPEAANLTVTGGNGKQELKLDTGWILLSAKSEE